MTDENFENGGFEDEEFPFIDFPRKKRDVPGLERFGIDLTMEARMGKMDPVIGRKKQTEELIEVLCRRRKNNAVLLGEPGVGKTAVAEGLAQKIATGDVPARLLHKRIISLDLSLMIAGTRYRGEFEARLRKVIDETKADSNVILVIDEMHNLIGAGSAEGAMDAANILKPPLARGELQCIGATTRDEYKRYVERDAALQRRFQPIIVPEPSIDETFEILKGLRDTYEIFHNVKFKDEALLSAAQFSSQYIADRFLPDKAIDLLDQSGARASLQFNTQDEGTRFIEKERESIRCVYLLKCEALRRGDIDLIKPLNDLEETWRTDLLRYILEKQLLDEENNKNSSDKEDKEKLNKDSLVSSIQYPKSSDYYEAKDNNFETFDFLKEFNDDYIGNKISEINSSKFNRSKDGWLNENLGNWYIPKSEQEIELFLDSIFEKEKSNQSMFNKTFLEFLNYEIDSLKNIFNNDLFESSSKNIKNFDEFYILFNKKNTKLDSFNTSDFIKNYDISHYLGQDIFKKLVEKKLNKYLEFSESQKSFIKDYLNYVFLLSNSKNKNIENAIENDIDKKIKSDPKEVWERLMKESENNKINKQKRKKSKTKEPILENVDTEEEQVSIKALFSLIVESLKNVIFSGFNVSGEPYKFKDANLKELIDYYEGDKIPGTDKSIERTQQIVSLLDELPRHIDWVELLSDPENPKFRGQYLYTSLYEELEQILSGGGFTDEEKEAIRNRMSLKEIAKEIREKYSFIARIAEKTYLEKFGKKPERSLDYSNDIRELEEEEEYEEEQLNLLNEKIKEIFGPDAKSLTKNKIYLNTNSNKRFKPLVEREILDDLRSEVSSSIPDGIFEKIYYELSNPNFRRKNFIAQQPKIVDNLRHNPLAKPIVGKNEIAELIAIQTGVPITDLTEDETEKLQNLENVLHQRVIGQDEAVSAVASAVRRARLGVRNPNRPIASFMFCGPTGVGKTELTKTLASIMFGSEDSIIRLDMSEYMEKHAVAQLLGAPPGYIGYSEGGQLTEKVRRKPYSVVLFDEIEKAHPDILDILLQLLDDARLTDAQGRTINFKNTIIILTSNVGAHQVQEHILAHQSKSLKNSEGEQESSDSKTFNFNKLNKTSQNEIGFVKTSDLKDRIFIKDENFFNKNENIENSASDQDYLELKRKVFEELRLYYRPEFLNRLDDVIVFKQLSKIEVRQIANIMVSDLVKRLKEQGYILQVTEEAKDALLSEGFDPLFGARPMRRAITKLIEDGVSETMLVERLKPGDTVIVDYSNKGFNFKVIYALKNSEKSTISKDENKE